MGLLPKDKDGNLIFKNVDFVNTWKALENCVSQGLVRSIGISNFNSQQINRLMKHCTIKPVTNQVGYKCSHSLHITKHVEFRYSLYILTSAVGFLNSDWSSRLLEPKEVDWTLPAARYDCHVLRAAGSSGISKRRLRTRSHSGSQSYWTKWKVRKNPSADSSPLLGMYILESISFEILIRNQSATKRLNIQYLSAKL